MNTPRLETERLILRKFTEDDMDDLYLLLSDEEVNTFLPWYPVKNLEETKAFYEARYAANYEKAHAYECFILGKHTARNGVAGISPPRREFQKC